jgi:hypothetical protein
MADKFIIEGAAFNGDGTTSSVAASAGAPGAWNSINIISGTAVGYGSLDSGDVIYIRSKTAAGADMSVSHTTITLGVAGSFTWILDNGDVWSGVNGTLTYTSNGLTVCTLRADNTFIAKTKGNIVFNVSGGDPNTSPWVSQQAGSYLIGCKFDLTNKTGVRSCPVKVNGIMESCLFYAGRLSSSGLFQGAYGGSPKLINAEIYLTNTTTGTAIFTATTNAGYTLDVIGGKIDGVGSDNPMPLVNAGIVSGLSGVINFYGMQIPATMEVWNIIGFNTGSRTSGFGVDGAAGSFISTYGGTCDSRADGFYPTLNAVLPETTNPWSWKVFLTTVNSIGSTVRLNVSKLYTGTGGETEATVYLLVSSGFAEINSNTCWFDLSYVDDTTGELVYLSSRAIIGAALTTSTAAWTATTYGATALDKYKITLSLPSDIKPDTLVFAGINFSAARVASDDLIFVCPDVQIT